MSYGLFGRSHTLDDVAEHRVWYFFAERRLTDGSFNDFLALVALIVPVLTLVGVLHWGLLALVPICVVLLWRNWRRYNERLFHALAERDREGIEPPVHPDRR